MSEARRTLVLFFPGCIEYEVMLAVELLNRRYATLVATPDGKPHVGSNGMTYQADLSYADAVGKDYAAILVPGGDPESVLDNEDIDRILTDAVSKNTILGAVCAGPLLLAKAGILKGHTVSHGYENEQLETVGDYFEGVDLSDALLTIEGNVITAKAPAHIDFAVAVAAAAGTIEDDKVISLTQYYKGLALG